MEASALKYQAPIGVHGRTPLLRLQSDERLIAILRRGNPAAFEVLVSRYESRLLAFCRHLLGSREDAEDVMQEVMTAAFNAIVADERSINVKPWLYRIARNRSLNHLRKTQAIAVDSMDHHLSDHGATTADKVHRREEFRMLVGDIQELPETQRTALVLREMDALSYEQIAEAMETTVSSVKSLLVRARVSLAEAAEARLLSCEEVRIELAEVSEGLIKKPGPLARRHLKDCKRCTSFQKQLKATNKALAALLPVGPLVVFRKLAIFHLGHSAGASAGSTAGATAAGSTAAGGAGAALGASGMLGGGSVVSAGMGAVATKAAAGLAAAVIVTAGAVEVGDHATAHHPAPPVASTPQHNTPSPIAPVQSWSEKPSTVAAAPPDHHAHHAVRHAAAKAAVTSTPAVTTPATTAVTTPATTAVTTTPPVTTTATTPTTTAPGRVQTQTDPTTVPATTTTPAPPIGPTTPVTSPVTSPVTTPVATATSPVTATPTTVGAATPTPTTTATTPTTVTTGTGTTTATDTTSATVPAATAIETTPVHRSSVRSRRPHRGSHR